MGCPGSLGIGCGMSEWSTQVQIRDNSLEGDTIGPNRNQKLIADLVQKHFGLRSYLLVNHEKQDKVTDKTKYAVPIS